MKLTKRQRELFVAFSRPTSQWAARKDARFCHARTASSLTGLVEIVRWGCRGHRDVILTDAGRAQLESMGLTEAIDA